MKIYLFTKVKIINCKPIFRSTKPFLLFFLFFLFGAQSCKKDQPITTEKDIQQTNKKAKSKFKAYNWSTSEKVFFSLVIRSKNNASKPRTETDLIYHPLLIRAYNEIAKQNEQNNFVDDIVNKSGLPAWEKSYIYYNPSTRDNIVMIPLAKPNENSVSAIITSTILHDQESQKIVVNAISRTEVLDQETGNAKQKLGFAQWFMKYDKLLFDNVDLALKDCVCALNHKINDPDYVEPIPVGCQWKLLELCDDTDLQITWWGGNVPSEHPTLGDHDGDGIPNKDDQDYQDLLNQGDHDGDGVPDRLDKDWYNLYLPIGDHDNDGIPNVRDHDWIHWFNMYGDHDHDGILNKDDQDWGDFTNRFPHWDHQIDDFDYGDYGDYSDFNDWWDDNAGGTDLFDLFNDFADVWYDLFDWFGDTWDNIWDWFGDIWDDIFHQDPDCWDGWRGSSKANSREIICNWVYVLICPDNGPDGHWWTRIVSCPTCTGNTNEVDERWNRISDFMHNFDGFDQGDDLFLFNLSKNGCSVFSPPPVFDECLKSKVIEDLKSRFPEYSAIISLMLEDGRPLGYIDNLLQRLSESHAAILQQPNPIPSNVGGVALSFSTPLCSSSIIIQPKLNDLDYVTAGINAMSFTVINSGGQPVTLTMASLNFVLPAGVNAMGNAPQVVIANAVNNALIQLQSDITNNQIRFRIPGVRYSVQEWFEFLIGRAMHQQYDLIENKKNMGCTQDPEIGNGTYAFGKDGLVRDFGTVYSNPDCRQGCP